MWWWDGHCSWRQGSYYELFQRKWYLSFFNPECNQQHTGSTNEPLKNIQKLSYRVSISGTHISIHPDSLERVSHTLEHSIQLTLFISSFWVYCANKDVNSSPPHGATYMRQRIRSALVQIMACRLFGAKPFSKPMLCYHQLDSYTPVTQDGDPAAICKIGQIAADRR